MKIEEGYSYEYLFYSVGFILIGSILAYFNPYIGLFVILVAILFLFDKCGTIFDYAENKIGRFHSLFGRRRFKWTSLDKYNSAELGFEFISQKMNSRGTSSTMRTKTFQLSLVGPKNKIIFHEYTNYAIAKKVLKILEEKCNLNITDSYAEVQKSAFERRKRRK